jgi:hypothetical protein
MSKRRGSRVIIALITSILIVFASTRGLADNIAPEVQTQINKRTDLFQKSINNLPSIEKSLEDKKQATINAMGDGKTSAPQGLSSITKQSKSDLENESGKLESIHENDLNSRGREEMMKKNVINELYPDYSRPLNKQYMKDAKDLSEGQNKLMANLFAKLKEVGVDCKTIKGDKKHEPEYFIKMKNSVNASEARKLGSGFGDTIYNQTFCEELRNKYHCNDEATLKCKRIGIRYTNPEARTIRFNGHTLHNNKMNWGFAVHWKTKRWGWHITPYHPGKTIFGWPDQVDSCWRDNPAAIIADARAYIAATLGVSIEQIGENVTFPASGRGIGNITPVYCRWRVVWDEYEFGYTYREIYHVCEEWAEDWNERCRLQ